VEFDARTNVHVTPAAPTFLDARPASIRLVRFGEFALEGREPALEDGLDEAPARKLREGFEPRERHGVVGRELQRDARGALSIRVGVDEPRERADRDAKLRGKTRERLPERYRPRIASACAGESFAAKR
jgi:hypothetical protein